MLVEAEVSLSSNASCDPFLTGCVETGKGEIVSDFQSPVLLEPSYISAATVAAIQQPLSV